MPSARVGASPRPAGGAWRQRAPAGLAPAGGLARGPSHALRPGPGPAVPQPTAQQEPGSPGQRAPRPPRPPRPGVSSAERPDPGRWRGGRSPCAGAGPPQPRLRSSPSQMPRAAPRVGPLLRCFPQSASGGHPRSRVMGWGRPPAFSPRRGPEFTRPPSPAPSGPAPHGHVGCGGQGSSWCDAGLLSSGSQPAPRRGGEDSPGAGTGGAGGAHPHPAGS